MPSAKAIIIKRRVIENDALDDEDLEEWMSCQIKEQRERSMIIES